MMSRNSVRKLVVMQIEDNPGDYLLMNHAFRRSGCHVDILHFFDGESALATLRESMALKAENRPDVILLDINLPGRNGLDVLEDLKQIEGLESIPVVVFTSSVASDEVTRAYANGASSYICKPSSLEEYDQTVTAIDVAWKSRKLVSRPDAGLCHEWE